MCFRVTTRVQKAEKDIIVYKFLRDYTKGPVSPHYHARWGVGAVKSSKLDLNHRNGSEINIGLHACKTISGAKKLNGTRVTIYALVIPKGAYFYKNASQYVSNRMKLKSSKPIK